MAKFTGVFRRVEIKYILSREQREALMQVLLPRVRPDEYGKTLVCNIYFDTPDSRLIRTSLEKPVYKEKLRLRTYGVPERDSTAFAELKKKYRGVVYKRRIALPYGEALRWLTGGGLPAEETQITREIQWFLQYYGGLAPAMALCYDRIAYDGENGLRITLDENIRWRQTTLDLLAGPAGRQLLKPGETLMELKAAGGMPLWLADALNELHIYPTSFSKYGRAYLDSIADASQSGGSIAKGKTYGSAV